MPKPRSPIDDCSMWDEVIAKYFATETWFSAYQLAERESVGKVNFFLGLVQGITVGEDNTYCRLLDRSGYVNVSFVADCVDELGLRDGDVLVVRDVAAYHGHISHRTGIIVGSRNVVEIVRP